MLTPTNLALLWDVRRWAPDSAPRTNDTPANDTPRPESAEKFPHSGLLSSPLIRNADGI